ncbi:MAG: hypothetical protein QM723_22065 [Myxococcaceae bacterium]
MRANGAALQGGLALIGLVAAYTTWQRPKDTQTETDITVLDASKSSLQGVKYEDGDRFIDMRKEDGRVWFTQGWMEGRFPASQPDAGEVIRIPVDGGVLPDGGIADGGFIEKRMQMIPAKPAPPKTVRGNERADKLWDKFTPLYGVRALGKLPNEKLKELGLFDAKRKLTVTVSGTARVYDVGNPSLNIVGMYLRDVADGSVYLLPAAMLSELEPSSQQLVDRRMHVFKMNEYDAFTITNGEVKKEFVSSNADIPQTAKVAAKETPDKPDELARNWSDKVFNRLIVTEVLGKDEQPAQGEPKVELRVDYTSGGKSKGFLEIGKAGGSVFGRSENTAGWVGLHMGTDDVLTDAKRIVGAK